MEDKIMRTYKYILKDRVPVPVEDTMEWAEWFEEADRKVCRDEISGILVSTIFLGLDSSFWEGPPLVFETMVFGGYHDGWQERYSTWEQAEAGHKKMVAMVRKKNTWYIRLYLWCKNLKNKKS